MLSRKDWGTHWSSHRSIQQSWCCRRSGLCAGSIRATRPKNTRPDSSQSSIAQSARTAFKSHNKLGKPTCASRTPAGRSRRCCCLAPSGAVSAGSMTQGSGQRAVAMHTAATCLLSRLLLQTAGTSHQWAPQQQAVVQRSQGSTHHQVAICIWRAGMYTEYYTLILVAMQSSPMVTALQMCSGIRCTSRQQIWWTPHLARPSTLHQPSAAAAAAQGWSPAAAGTAPGDPQSGPPPGLCRWPCGKVIHSVEAVTAVNRQIDRHASEAVQQWRELRFGNSREDLGGCEQAAQALRQGQSSEGQHLLQHLHIVVGSTVSGNDKAPTAQPPGADLCCQGHRAEGQHLLQHHSLAPVPCSTELVRACLSQCCCLARLSSPEKCACIQLSRAALQAADNMLWASPDPATNLPHLPGACLSKRCKPAQLSTHGQCAFMWLLQQKVHWLTMSLHRIPGSFTLSAYVGPHQVSSLSGASSGQQPMLQTCNFA